MKFITLVSRLENFYIILLNFDLNLNLLNLLSQLSQIFLIVFGIILMALSNSAMPADESLVSGSSIDPAAAAESDNFKSEELQKFFWSSFFPYFVGRRRSTSSWGSRVGHEPFHSSNNDDYLHHHIANQHHHVPDHSNHHHNFAIHQQHHNDAHNYAVHGHLGK